MLHTLRITHGNSTDKFRQVCQMLNKAYPIGLYLETDDFPRMVFDIAEAMEKVGMCTIWHFDLINDRDFGIQWHWIVASEPPLHELVLVDRLSQLPDIRGSIISLSAIDPRSNVEQQWVKRVP